MKKLLLLTTALIAIAGQADAHRFGRFRFGHTSGPPATPDEPACDITVNTSAQMNAQANSLANNGKVVCLTPGTYGLLSINANHTTPVTIRTANPLDESSTIIKGIEGPAGGINANGYTFKNLTFTTDFTRTQDTIRTNGDTGLTFDSVTITSDPLKWLVNGRQAVRIVNGSNITITNSLIRDVPAGIIVSGTHDIHVTYNTITDTHWADAMQFETSYNVWVEHNFVTRMSTSGVHPDALQFLTTNAVAANSGHDIHVNYNMYCRGVGFFSAQGFPFMGNEKYNFGTRYTNVEIVGNVNIGAQFGGISLDGAINFNVSDNIVRGWTDQNSWIRVLRSDGGSIANNTTTSMNNGTGGSANINTTITGTTTIAQADTPECETQP